MALRSRGDDPLIGRFIGAYRVVERLAVGGMAWVYKCVQPSIGSRVATKVLSHECAARPDLVERFFSEARAVNMIRHERIVNILDLAQLQDGRPYIIMEFLDGVPLANLVDRAPMPLGTSTHLVIEVLGAMAAAHTKGIVHRDLKPDNIFVTPAGHPKVLDFGIAQVRSELIRSATQTGLILGTPHYMSPEQSMGKPIDLRTDIYATGVILFECATGRRPFEADSLPDLLRKQALEAPPSPRSVRPAIPAELEHVIRRAMAKDPDQRYRNAHDLAQALSVAVAGLPAEHWAPLMAGGRAHMSPQRNANPPASGPRTHALSGDLGTSPGSGQVGTPAGRERSDRGAAATAVMPEVHGGSARGTDRHTRRHVLGAVALASGLILLVIAVAAGRAASRGYLAPSPVNANVDDAAVMLIGDAAGSPIADVAGAQIATSVAMPIDAGMPVDANVGKHGEARNAGTRPDLSPRPGSSGQKWLDPYP